MLNNNDLKKGVWVLRKEESFIELHHLKCGGDNHQWEGDCYLKYNNKKEWEYFERIDFIYHGGEWNKNYEIIPKYLVKLILDDAEIVEGE